MRILVVSAHYPPNFVSGGTLQPQRLARGLRDRGHEVSVYAGWLDSARKPLETWTEADETGMSVRWAVTTPWIGWDDRRNWDNPGVTADFAGHLRDVTPDVVHFHSLQGLGAGLLAEAARAGAAVVVTMHDFWWVCSRQFLVDTAMRPCSLVVDAGCCPCEVDHAWLEGRNRWLACALAHADLVLAPSTPAAEVFAANGVDPARLKVDENGLPGGLPVGDRPLARHDGTLRLLYTGGSNPMKGVDVLLAAARRLAPVPGWTLRAYDVDTYLTRSSTSVDGLPVEVLPAFDPADVEEVYAWAEVLVLPSVMRESHSLVTREALVRGLPVVCTDTLGPEEVVEPGSNGLVVAAGDARALAGALRRLVEEPGLLAALREGASRPPAVRSLDDQVAGLEATLARACAGRAPGVTAPPAATPSRRRVGHVVFACGIDGAPLRYRARLPAEALGLLGVSTEVRHYRDPELQGLVDEADALVVYRVPATVQVLALIERAKRRGVPVFFDVDDLIFDPDVAAEIPALRILPTAEAELWMEGVRRYRTTMEACDAFVGSTDALCRHAHQVTGMPAHRFSNGVGLQLGRLSDEALHRPRRPGPPRLGYFSGTNTHDHDWLMIEPAIVEILGRHRGAELWLVGQVAPSSALDRFGDRVVRLPAVDWTALPSHLRQVDVNLAPLEPGSRFNEAKSAIKWVEAALTETASVASPTAPYREVVVHGRNGMLAASGGEWLEAVESLVVDEEHRSQIARRARRDALLDLSPHLQGRRYLDILQGHTGDRRPAGHGSAWVPVVHDEPPEPVVLTPYGDHGSTTPPPINATARDQRVEGRRLAESVRRGRSLAGLAYESLQRQGVVATTRRAVKSVLRNATRAR